MPRTASRNRSESDEDEVDDGRDDDDIDHDADISSEPGLWRRSYESAHLNPHDPWVTHWNVVFPNDIGTCPGKTYVFEGCGVATF